MSSSLQSGSEAPLILDWSPLLEQHPLAHFVYEVETLKLLAVNAAALLRYGCTQAEFLSQRLGDRLMAGELGRLRSFLIALPHGAQDLQQIVWVEKTHAGVALHADVRGLAGLWQGRAAKLCVVIDAGQRELLSVHADHGSANLDATGVVSTGEPGWLQGLRTASSDLWIVFDAEHRFAEVSDPHHPALTVPWDQRQGRRVVDALEPKAAQELLAYIQQAHATRQTQVLAYQRHAASGQLCSFEARYVALHGGRTLALIRDVTQTRLLEHRFQSLAEAAPIGIFLTDADGACTYTNAAWQTLFGLDAQQSQGHGWSTTLHPEDRGKVIRAWQHHAERKQSFDMEFRLQPIGQPPHVVWTRANPILTSDGTVSAHVGAVVDVTVARQLQAERQARAVAEEAGRQQSVFMSRASHELRTPLNAILGFGELLQRDPAVASGSAGTYVAHVLKAGRHMLALVDDLLELQRLQQDQRQPANERVAVGALLQASQQMLQPLADTAGVAIAVECVPSTAWHTDERMLRQILLNLGSNAIKYGGRGSTLTLAARELPRGLQVTVSDNGPGMTAEQVGRLFQPFDRLGQDRNGVPGTGLGLVITRQLATALGAQLALHSQYGAGTQAVITFQQPAA